MNLCASGTLVPMMQGELLAFFDVRYTAENLIPDKLPEVTEQLQRARQFYEQDLSPQYAQARQNNQERCRHVPAAGIFAIPDFLYLNPIAINGTPQMGVFTAEPLPAGAWLGTYTGVLLPASHTTRSLYALFFEDRAAGVSLRIDAQHHGNHARFMNHSEHPNAKPESFFYQGMYHVGMRTLCAVAAHQQLVYDYSKAYWDKLGIQPDVL